MKLMLTEKGLEHYTKSRASKERSTGTLLHTLPSKALVVDWSWGIGIHDPDEVEECIE